VCIISWCAHSHPVPGHDRVVSKSAAVDLGRSAYLTS
jgi:hypothetical protein